MKTVIVLAMHGAPPNDFPKRDLGEFFALHGRMEQSGAALSEEARARHAQLEARLLNWPRTPANDPFCAGSHELAEHLRRESGREVMVGFNEFCAPTLDGALDEAVRLGAEEVVVITPMMTRGGGHSTGEIPAAIAQAQKRHPGVRFVYAWPFDTAEVARFLAEQVAKHV